MTEKNGSTESSTGQSKEIILGEVIKRAETAQMPPTQNVVQSPFADHIPGLQARPGQVQPDSQTPANSTQPIAPNSGDVPSSDSSE